MASATIEVMVHMMPMLSITMLLVIAAVLMLHFELNVVLSQRMLLYGMTLLPEGLTGMGFQEVRLNRAKIPDDAVQQGVIAVFVWGFIARVTSRLLTVYIKVVVSWVLSSRTGRSRSEGRGREGGLPGARS